MTNCGPCQTIRPYVERMAADGLPVFKVDLNSRPDLAQQFQVNSAPTFVLEVNGRETWRSSGVPGGDGFGVAQRLRTRLTTAVTANAAQIARAQRGAGGSSGRGPAPPNATPRRPVEPSEVPLQLTGGRDENQSESGGGFFSWLKGKPKDEGPKTIDDPFAAADPAGFASSNPPSFASETSAAGSAADGVDAPPVSPTRDPMKTAIRIRVFDNRGKNLGSGTIIASRPGRAVALTCGHIFKSYQPGARIEVDTFAHGAPRTFPATLIGFELKSDVGLLAIDCPEVLPASPLAAAGITTGDKVVSVGCDGGDEPTLQGHVVLRVPACTGPANFSCTGQPLQGRSGGGCFDAAGRLVGVVWSRMEEPPAGLYSAIEPINALLDKHGLTALKAPAATPATPAARTSLADAVFPGDAFPDDAAFPASQSPHAAAPSSNPPTSLTHAGASDADDRPATDDPAADAGIDAFWGEADPAPARTASAESLPPATATSSAAVADALGASGGAEITCIIRPLGPNGGPTRIVVINQATQRTLALLQGDAAGGAVETSLYQPTTAAPAPTSTPPPPPIRLGNGIGRTAGDAPRTFCRPLVCRPRRVRR